MVKDSNSIVPSEEPKGNVVIYTSEDGRVKLDVQIGGETVWLTTQQMAVLFDRDDSNIRKHITKIFADGELVRENNVHFLPVNGVKKPVPFYNLDVIISVGYRVHSIQGVRFRQWVLRQAQDKRSVLKEFIVKGFALDDESFSSINSGRAKPRINSHYCNYKHGIYIYSPAR